MGKALLAAGVTVVLTIGVPVAGATTYVVGGTNGVGGGPSQAETARVRGSRLRSGRPEYVRHRLSGAVVAGVGHGHPRRLGAPGA